MSDNNAATKRKPEDPPASPYGPQPNGADEAAGGADSSPYENEPTGERMDKAKAGRTQQDAPGANPPKPQSGKN